MLSEAVAPLPKLLVSLEKTCDFDSIQRFAALSDDFNPIHVDREFAAAGPMGGIVAHGPMSLGLVFQVLRNTLSERWLDGISVDVYFRRPVRENDVVTAGGELRDGTRTYAVWVKNQKEEIVVEGEARVVEDAAAEASA